MDLNRKPFDPYINQQALTGWSQRDEERQALAPAEHRGKHHEPCSRNLYFESRP